jgi:hypothetical protein
MAEHEPVFCAHCGAVQKKSLILANPPTPTVCMTCGGAVVLGGALFMERMSELSPEAHALSVIRLALSQVRARPKIGRVHA